MNPLYQKAKDIVVMRRTADNKEFEEFPLIVSDSSVIATDVDNNLFCYKICELLRHVLSASYSETGSFAYSSSYSFSGSNAVTSSHALDALSASYSLSGSYVISASWAETSSFALEASAAYSAAYASDAVSSSYALTASYAITASHEVQIDITASWASASLSASYAESASYGTNFYAPRVTASYVSSSFNVITNQLTASNALIRGIAVTTASWAINALNANSAVAAGSASAALWSQTASLAYTASTAVSASYAESASYGANFYAPRVTASFVSASVNTVTHNFTASNGYIDNFTSYGQSVISNILASFIGTTEVDADYSIIQQLTASDATITGRMMGTASYALQALSSSEAEWAQMASMSLATRGLNVLNLPPQPNAQIVFGNFPVAPYNNSPATVGTTNTSESNPHATVKVNNKLYGAGWGGKIFVINDPDGDVTNVTTASFIGGNGASGAAYSSVSGYIYVLCGASISGSIVRVDPNDIVGGQHVIVQGLPAYPTLAPLVCDDNYLYTLTNGLIYQWDLNGTLVNSTPSVSASVAIGGSHGGTVSTDKEWVYFSIFSPGMIFKVKTNNITNNTASAHLIHCFPVPGDWGGVTDDICYLNGYVYATVEVNGNIWKINATDLTYTCYPAAWNSYGVFSDLSNVYLLQGPELWVYLNGDLASGPIRFVLAGGGYAGNEFWITDGGRVFISNWTTPYIYSYYLPITRLGLNKSPTYTLDVAGTINADIKVQSPVISASTTLAFGAGTQTGTLTWNGSSGITSSPSGQGRLLVSTASIRIPTISASAALLGRVDNVRFSQSFMAGDVLAYTRSLGTIGQDGMYRLTVAGTMGFYSGSTLVNQPKWQFLHTDRFGAYLLPQSPLTPLTLTAPPNYEYAFSFGTDYIFQAVAGSTIAYYYNSNGAQVSSTDCSASFFTSTTLTQIMSGSVTGSI